MKNLPCRALAIIQANRGRGDDISGIKITQSTLAGNATIVLGWV